MLPLRRAAKKADLMGDMRPANRWQFRIDYKDKTLLSNSLFQDASRPVTVRSRILEMQRS